MSRILVTGASGNVGREVVRSLKAKGFTVRSAGRDSERAKAVHADDVERVSLDFSDPGTFEAAVKDCQGLFLLRPPPISNVKTTLNPFIDAARAHGVDHVVFLSVEAAATNKMVPHHAVEMHLKSRPGQWTLLRPGFFAQNLGDAYVRDIVDDDRLYVPAGTGRVSFVDVRDVADVAVLAFSDPQQHAGKAYILTGPEAVTFEEAARLLSEAVGRKIRYVPASIVGYLLHLRKRRLPATQIIVQIILHTLIRAGKAKTVDPTLRELLGHAPRSLRDYVHDHAKIFLRENPGPV